MLRQLILSLQQHISIFLLPTSPTIHRSCTHYTCPLCISRISTRELLTTSFLPTMSYQQPSHPSGYPGQQGYQQTQTQPSTQQHNPRSDASGLPQGQERSEQVEHFQSYEAAAPQTQDDIDQATLAREFPSVDSSLIAAFYSDTKSLSDTREMLQALTQDEK